jgi:dethiobiotin synthetase
MSPLFVTSSGTDVGKTLVCSRLIAELGQTRPVRAIKPIATGMDEREIAPGDTVHLLQAQGILLDGPAIERTTPWRFRAALAPAQAAAREGRQVPFADLLAFSRPRSAAELTIVEGIGGVMVPLDDSHTVLDWIAALKPVVWLVVGSYLGALSHSLTAAAVLRQRGITLGAVIVSESVESVGLTETLATLAHFLDGLPLVGIPRPPPPLEQQRLFDSILATLPPGRA